MLLTIAIMFALKEHVGAWAVITTPSTVVL